MKEKDVEKNILDLKHSMNLTKAGTCLALAFSLWVAIFFGMKEFYSNIRIIIFIATFVFILFSLQAIKFFKKCEAIHSHIKDL